MSASTQMKVEVEVAAGCVVCGYSGSELLTPEEHDAAAPGHLPPLRSMLLHLNNNKVIPEGRICVNCAHRAVDSYEFSNTLSSRTAAPLSEKIRALRRRLHELTQKIDVFIVVGGGGGGAYSEEDIIMVDKDALAKAAAADAEEQERALNARGENVYQCTVCPLSFQTMSELRAHSGSHGAEARHSCWSCGQQFDSRAALAAHAATHRPAPQCHLCQLTFQSEGELSQHAAGAGCRAACPACGAAWPSRAALAAHVAAHAPPAPPPHVCAACFLSTHSAADYAAHELTHKHQKHYVCGYDSCILRFATRGTLMSHIRKCHGGDPTAAPADAKCPHCPREFATDAALARHVRVHRQPSRRAQVKETVSKEEPAEVPAGEAGRGEDEGEAAGQGEDEGEAGQGDGEDEQVEYLEMETLDEEYEDMDL